MRRLVAIVAVLGTWVVAGAFAAPTGDPQGDVVSRAPCECSNYGQDLKSADVTTSSAGITFAITQYDSMNNAFAAAYYGPQVAIYTDGLAAPTYAIVPRSDGMGGFKPTLVAAANFGGSPCAGPAAATGVTTTYDAAFTSASYTIGLPDIGNRASFYWQVVNPGVPGCGPEPVAEATDVLPDSGPTLLMAIGPTATPTVGPAPTPTPGLNAARTLPNLGGVPAKQTSAKTLGGALILRGPATSLTISAGGVEVTKRNVRAGRLAFKIKLPAKLRKQLAKGAQIKVPLAVTVHVADGSSVTRSAKIRLISGRGH